MLVEAAPARLFEHAERVSEVVADGEAGRRAEADLIGAQRVEHRAGQVRELQATAHMRVGDAEGDGDLRDRHAARREIGVVADLVGGLERLAQVVLARRPRPARSPRRARSAPAPSRTEGHRAAARARAAGDHRRRSRPCRHRRAARRGSGSARARGCSRRASRCRPRRRRRAGSSDARRDRRTGCFRSRRLILPSMLIGEPFGSGRCSGWAPASGTGALRIRARRGA